jgi:hypothetical protein
LITSRLEIATIISSSVRHRFAMPSYCLPVSAACRAEDMRSCAEMSLAEKASRAGSTEINRHESAEKHNAFARPQPECPLEVREK